MTFYVNENINPLVPGDVQRFPDMATLLKELEPWYVDEPHLVFDETFCVWKLKAARKGLTLIQTDEFLATDLAKQLVARAERIH